MRRWHICRGCGMLCVVLLCGFAQARADGRIGEYTALRLIIGSGRYAEATARCEQLIERYPEYLALYETLAEVCQYAGQLDLAREFLEARVRAGKNVKEAYFGLANVMYKLADYGGAFGLFHKCSMMGLMKPECYKGMLYSYERHRGEHAAVRWFTTSANDNPDDWLSWYALALGYWGTGDFGRTRLAIAEVRGAGACDPKVLQISRACELALKEREVNRMGVRLAAEAAAQDGDLEGAFFLRSCIVNSYYRNERWSDAKREADRLRDVASKYGFFTWQGWAQKILSDVFLMRGQYQVALEICDGSVQAAHKAKDHKLLLTSLARKFWLLVELARFPEAVSVGHERLDLAELQRDEAEEINTKMDLAQAYYEIGDYQVAMKYALSCSNSLVGKETDKDRWAQLQVTLSQIHLALGNTHLALGHLLSVQKQLVGTTFTNQLQSVVYGNLGMVHFKIGDVARAAQCFEKQLLYAQKSKYEREEAFALRNLGQLRLRLGKPIIARRFFDGSLALSERLCLHLNSIECLGRLGEIAEGERDRESALRYYQRAMEALSNLGQLDRTRCGPAGEISRSIYYRFVHLLSQMNRIRDGFSWAEKAHLNGRSDILALFQRQFAESLTDSSRVRLMEAMLNLEQKKARRAEVSLKHEQTDIIEEQQVLLREIADSEVEWRSAIKEARSKDPLFAQMIEPLPIDLRHLQNEVLPNKVGLVEYLIGEESSELFFVTRDTLVHYCICAGRKDLDRLIRRVGGTLVDVPKGGLLDSVGWRHLDVHSLNTIRQVLIGPIEERIKNLDGLIFVPDGVLFNLPFEMLYGPSDLGGNESRFLVQSHDISYGFAATLLDTVGRRRNEPKKGVLALGDPEWIQGSTTTTTLGRWKEPDESEYYFPPLPGAYREVNDLSRLLPGEVDVRLRAAATREAIFQEAGDYKVIHIATHATSGKSGNPMASALLLSQGPAQSVSGLTYAHELVNLKLHASLVVLSACHSGRVPSDFTVAGLVRAFMLAGVPSVVSSLWDAEDATTAELMSAFYSNIAKGYRISHALRLAKLGIIETGKRDPFYWASFILVGPDVAIPLRQGSVSITEETWTEFLLFAIPLLLLLLSLLPEVRRKYSTGSSTESKSRD
jgi:CHAT domain-containing protein/tetratricopeptide (TPR) repeat protein